MNSSSCPNMLAMFLRPSMPHAFPACAQFHRAHCRVAFLDRSGQGGCTVRPRRSMHVQNSELQCRQWSATRTPALTCWPCLCAHPCPMRPAPKSTTAESHSSIDLDKADAQSGLSAQRSMLFQNHKTSMSAPEVTHHVHLLSLSHTQQHTHTATHTQQHTHSNTHTATHTHTNETNECSSW